MRSGIVEDEPGAEAQGDVATADRSAIRQLELARVERETGVERVGRRKDNRAGPLLGEGRTTDDGTVKRGVEAVGINSHSRLALDGAAGRPVVAQDEVRVGIRIEQQFATVA